MGSVAYMYNERSKDKEQGGGVRALGCWFLVCFPVPPLLRLFRLAPRVLSSGRLTHTCMGLWSVVIVSPCRSLWLPPLLSLSPPSSHATVHLPPPCLLPYSSITVAAAAVAAPFPSPPSVPPPARSEAASAPSAERKSLATVSTDSI